MSPDSNAERELFEAAWKKFNSEPKDTVWECDVDGDYYDHVVLAAWQSWQLARSQPSEWVATTPARTDGGEDANK